MKPGQMANLPMPIESEMEGVAAAAQVGRGSNQTPATVQTASLNPNRLVPPQMPVGSSGKATVERNGIMENQTSNYIKCGRPAAGQH